MTLMEAAAAAATATLLHSDSPLQSAANCRLRRAHGGGRCYKASPANYYRRHRRCRRPRRPSSACRGAGSRRPPDPSACACAGSRKIRIACFHVDSGRMEEDGGYRRLQSHQPILELSHFLHVMLDIAILPKSHLTLRLRHGSQAW